MRYRRSTVWIKVLLPALALGLLAPGTGSARHRAGKDAGAPGQPNIIMILADDLDVNLLSLDYMPNLQVFLAGKGLTFTNYFVPISLCCPSRTTILTGMYPHNHGVFTNTYPEGGFRRFQELNLDRATIGTALQKAGYRTSLMGKYINDYPRGSEKTYVPPGWSEWNVPADNDAYAEFNYTLNENGTLVFHGTAEEDYLTDVLSGKAKDFIQRMAGGQQPFFLYLATYAPHRPATPAPRHENLFPDLIAPRAPNFNEADVSAKPKDLQFDPLTQEGIDFIDYLYPKRIRSLQAVDELVLNIIRTLRRTGLINNTYVVFTSDNGFHMGQHRFLAGKYTAYEEDIHVPLIVRGPGVPAGATIDALSSSVDLAPTFAELAGTKLRFAHDGRSLVPLLSGTEPPGWRQAVLIEQRPFSDLGKAYQQKPKLNLELKTPPARMGAAGLQEPPDAFDSQIWPPIPYVGLRTHRWKYVEYANGEREMYNLSIDPYELVNRSSFARHSLINQLSGVLHQLQYCQGDACTSAESTPLP